MQASIVAEANLLQHSDKCCYLLTWKCILDSQSQAAIWTPRGLITEANTINVTKENIKGFQKLFFRGKKKNVISLGWVKLRSWFFNEALLITF